MLTIAQLKKSDPVDPCGRTETLIFLSRDDDPRGRLPAHSLPSGCLSTLGSASTHRAPARPCAPSGPPPDRVESTGTGDTPSQAPSPSLLASHPLRCCSR